MYEQTSSHKHAYLFFVHTERGFTFFMYDIV